VGIDPKGHLLLAGPGHYLDWMKIIEFPEEADKIHSFSPQGLIIYIAGFVDIGCKDVLELTVNRLFSGFDFHIEFRQEFFIGVCQFCPDYWIGLELCGPLTGFGLSGALSLAKARRAIYYYYDKNRCRKLRHCIIFLFLQGL
jgi:hypothetical protein